MLKRIFAWWNGATLGALFDIGRRGVFVGEDEQGNRYYEERRPSIEGRRRRYVLYNGLAEASRVSPDWHAWMHHIVEPPTQKPLKRQAWEKPPTDGLVLHETVNPSKNRQLNAGDTVWPGQVLLTMPDFSRIEARVYVLESDGGGLAVGQKASVTVDSHPTVAFDAHLTNVDLRARQLYNDSPV